MSTSQAMLKRVLRSVNIICTRSAISRHTWTTDPYDIRKILCEGPILHNVQLSGLFRDSKTFTDMKLKTNIIAVLDNWKLIEREADGKPIPKEVIQKFVQENFEPSVELVSWTPPDWRPDPSVIEKVRHPVYKKFAADLNKVWLRLARRMPIEARKNLKKTSLIYVPNGFIVPGGRFQELYYWDTYWIVKGLLICDMVETARGMIQNLLYLLKTHGHIYNGSRIYYQFRSQPPLLIPMVAAFCEFTNDFTLVAQNFKLLESEVIYWEKSRRINIHVDGTQYRLFRYYCPCPGPRPEAYKEDYTTVQDEETEDAKKFRYRAIASAAESGWDFSSRWYWRQAGDTLKNVHTQLILPADLNAFLHLNYVILRNWAKRLHFKEEEEKYAVRSRELKNAVQNVLWDEVEGIWFDVDVRSGARRRRFYLSNMVPAWTETFDPERKSEIAEKIKNYYHRFNLWKYRGGLPTTMYFSGEQWDWPNAWAPLQAMIAQGLDKIGLPYLAYTTANNWIYTNYLGFQENKVIYEKYDCTTLGTTGSGGEYEDQEGFGWSNGVLFEFLCEYGGKAAPAQECL